MFVFWGNIFLFKIASFFSFKHLKHFKDVTNDSQIEHIQDYITVNTNLHIKKRQEYYGHESHSAFEIRDRRIAMALYNYP